MDAATDALRDRIVVVTGAGSGLGRAHARELAGHGAAVIVNDLSAGLADDVVKEIRSAGGRARANYDDVSDWNGARNLIDSALRGFGDLDALVNNAGIMQEGFFETLDEKAWDQMIAVNMKGSIATAYWATKYWIGQERNEASHIVNTGSVAGLHGSAGQSSYAATKGAVVALSLTLAAELGVHNIRVNVVIPRAWTPMRASLANRPARLDQVVASFDAWDPANVSPLVAYLVSSACRVSGEVLYAKGGDVSRMSGWREGGRASQDRRWSFSEVAAWMQAKSEQDARS